MKGIESIDKELDLMIKYNLSAEEMLLIKYIFIGQEGNLSYLSKYFTEVSNKTPIRSILLNLQNNGIINKSYTIPEQGTKFNPLDIEFNKTFIKSYLQHSGDLGMELFMNYPAFVMINGKQFSLKNVSKLYRSVDEFSFAYGKAIGFNKDKHNKILEILQWAKEHNLISYGICEFLASMKWLELNELKDKGNYSFNTSELL